MSQFFPYQRLRIEYHEHGDDRHAYEGPGEYVRPVNPDDEDILLPESNEPMHYVRIMLGNNASEHIFPESALRPAPQRDLGGLMDRVHEMLDQIGPMMVYLQQQLEVNSETQAPFSAGQESFKDQQGEFEKLRSRLRDIALDAWAPPKQPTSAE
ncbi:MAG: hypothetical protein ACFB21_09895 [Opitutales bacterium]